MIIRLRSRDGLERVELPDSPAPTVADLRAVVLQRLALPSPDDLIALSTDPRLLTAKSDADVAAAVAASPAALNDATSPTCSASSPLASSAGLGHGAMLFVLYRGERAVAPAARPDAGARPFGARLTIDDVSARTARIERQEKAKCQGVSFDRAAADAFQRYVQGALGFSRARAGVLYGSSDEGGNVRVEWVYEPPQEGSKNVAAWRPDDGGGDGAEAARADAVAAAFGLRRVGLVLAQAFDRSRDFILSDVELRQAACSQHACGELGVTVLVTWDDAEGEGGEGQAGGHVHFEAFQCSEQCVRLWRDGWFAPLGGEAAGVADPPAAEGRGAAADEGGGAGGAKAGAAATSGGGGGGNGGSGNGAGPMAAGMTAPPAPPAPPVGHTLSGKRPKNPSTAPLPSTVATTASSGAYAPAGATRMQYPADPSSPDPVLLTGRGAREVDNDFFLCPVKILDHEGPLLARFPVENRLVPQTRDDLRAQLRGLASLPYERRLADAHLLLWLSGQPNLDEGDCAAVCAAAAGRTGPLMEGYRVIIDSIAGV